MALQTGQRPAKRPRTRSDASVLVRSEIWMPYGDIVVQVESTLFRVNRDILAKHSSVFESMFLLPQPANQETIDGCAVVELSDSTKDVKILLTAMYDPFHHKFSQPFEVVAAYLRLGRKYDIMAFKDDAVSRLRHEFPSRLALWDGRMAKAKLVKITESPGVHVDLLNLAYELGIYRCIPALAFECLKRYTLGQLFQGVKRQDGSRALVPDSTKITLALALEKLNKIQFENLGWPFSSTGDWPCEECRDNHDIKADYNLDDGTDNFTRLEYVLQDWNAVNDMHSDRISELCEEECCDLAEAEWRDRRWEIWKKLPSIFDAFPIERFGVAVIDTGIELSVSARHLRISVGFSRFGVFQLFRLSPEQLGRRVLEHCPFHHCGLIQRAHKLLGQPLRLFERPCSQRCFLVFSAQLSRCVLEHCPFHPPLWSPLTHM
ncbi:hypothetical protein B0H17DRAFT_1331519 [Mycena rosella]|uniref:BTB domain-containing protein n=1 Tax=Mycena rosella TaxID=1033263 RepID=A0AAD7DH25_MYCRO|nr:hypothetical protein B0H17DRAFT_1331519 [Mycena rosella]